MKCTGVTSCILPTRQDPFPPLGYLRKQYHSSLPLLLSHSVQDINQSSVTFSIHFLYHTRFTTARRSVTFIFSPSFITFTLQYKKQHSFSPPSIITFIYGHQRVVSLTFSLCSSPTGTHGHMKCYFNGQLKSQDTILLNLYKRMFPKWTLDPFVPRPPPLYIFHTAHHSDSDDDDDDEEEGKERKGGQEPPSKKSKMVKFFS